MPFDGTQIETPALRRALLLEALKNLPRNFEWNFWKVYKRTSCGAEGCAVGLACSMWPALEKARVVPERQTAWYGWSPESWDYRKIAKFLGMTEKQVKAIFFNEGPCGGHTYGGG